MSASESSVVYAIVGNIPDVYHSSDLRNYFSQFIESGGFDCFHFRHRPEEKRSKTQQEGGDNTHTSTGSSDTDSVSVSEPQPEPPSSSGIVARAGVLESDSLSVSTSQSSRSSSKDFSLDSALGCPAGFKVSNIPKVDDNISKHGPVHNNIHNTRNTKDSRSTKQKPNTCCCIVKLEVRKFIAFMKMYNRRHWLDLKGEESLPSLCIISKIKISTEDEVNKRYQTRREAKQIPVERESFTSNDLQNLLELKPPHVMPQGNVGTPTKTFLDAIKSCKLPPSIIAKLGLIFPKSKSNKRYGCVPFDYGGEVVAEEEEESWTVTSASGKDIDCEGERLLSKPKEMGGNLKSESCNVEMTEEPESQDADECEEWERHEALMDDPTNIERNKERVFEEELEIVWEKGGSGLVYYTDSQYWRQQEGDFEEQTTDDWDVDMSVYYDKHAGDMDSRDYVKIRQETRRRKGEEATDMFTSGIGKFEKHTKGFGRHVMEKQGWSEGKGLGIASVGLAEALDNDGQKPRDKSGFGYRGEKILKPSVIPGRKRPHKSADILISTVYDDPEETDPAEPLYRRLEPYHLKHRHHGVNFVQGPTEGATSHIAPKS